jgi:carbon starvation protein
VWKKLGDAEWLPGSLGATAFMVLAWGYFIWTGNINTIWPLFGIANQLLGAVALAVATTGAYQHGANARVHGSRSFRSASCRLRR